MQTHSKLLIVVIPVLGLLYYWAGPPKQLPDRFSVIPDSAVNINNEVYETHADTWHTDGGSLNLITLINPPRFHYFYNLLREKFPSKKPRILDVGCGGGILTNEIASAGFETMGIDIAKNSLQAARQNANQRGISSVKYSYGSAYSIPFADASFDVVLISDVLEHLLDLRTAISEIRRVLKPNGILLFDTINRTHFSYWITIFFAEKVLRLFGPVDHLHDWTLYITPDELITNLKQVGFSADMNEWKGLRPSFSISGLFSQGFFPGFINTFQLSSLLWGNYVGYASAS